MGYFPGSLIYPTEADIVKSLGQCNQLVQGFAESLQQDSSNQSEIVMIKLYCCGPGYCSRYPLLYYFFQIRNGLGSSVFKLCCKDSAKPCTSLANQPAIFTTEEVLLQILLLGKSENIVA